VSVFLTGVEGLNQPTNPTPSEMIRLNTTTPVTAEPNRLGVLGGDAGGFPNGRRLTDDVVDIEIQTLEGAIQPDGSIALVPELATGDGVNANDVAFEDSFPYVALPNPGSNTGPGGLGGPAQGNGGGPAPSGGVATGLGGASASDSPAEGGSNGLPMVPMAVLAAGLAVTAFGVGRSKRAKA
jgi:hypothetical protein